MTNKELLAQVAKEQRELARLEGQALRTGKPKPEWDPYYLELEWGTRAMEYVTSRPFGQMDLWLRSGKEVTYEGDDITPLLRLWFESGLWGAAKPAATKQALSPRPTEWGTFS